MKLLFIICLLISVFLVSPVLLEVMEKSNAQAWSASPTHSAGLCSGLHDHPCRLLLLLFVSGEQRCKHLIVSVDFTFTKTVSPPKVANNC